MTKNKSLTSGFIVPILFVAVLAVILGTGAFIYAKINKGYTSSTPVLSPTVVPQPTINPTLIPVQFIKTNKLEVTPSPKPLSKPNTPSNTTDSSNTSPNYIYVYITNTPVPNTPTINQPTPTHINLPPTNTPTPTPMLSGNVTINTTSITVSLSRANQIGGFIYDQGVIITNGTYGVISFCVVNNDSSQGQGLQTSSGGLGSGQSFDTRIYINTNKLNGNYTGSQTVKYGSNCSSTNGTILGVISYSINLTD